MTPPHTDEQPTDSTGPVVTVVITTYNRPAYLQRAVETVCEQTYDPIELVVVDDHSTERARPVVDAADTTGLRTVHCVRHEENRGANAARNTGINRASGTYIAFLDDDDRWEPTKLQRQVAAFEDGDEEVGIVYTGTRTIEGDEQRVVTPEPVTGNMTRALLCRNVVGTLSAVMVRADLAAEFPLDERFPSWADLEWYVRLSTAARFERVPEPLVVYEFDSHNRLSDDYGKTERSYALFVEAFDSLAARYGRLFRRKMRGWAAYRAGTAALHSNHYRQARRHLATAVRWYPFEPRFGKYLLATLGGRYTHGIARTARRLLS